MIDPTEVELKLDFGPENQARLVASSLLGLNGTQPKQLVATYFDTPDLQLAKAGYALRIRTDGANRIQTVKAADHNAAGLFVRGEWERTVEDDRPVLDKAAGPLVDTLDAEAIDRIEPLFITDVRRYSALVEHGATQIELAVDSGEVRAGQRSAPLSEIEFELKRGSPQQLFDLARRLDEEVPLRLGVRTKSALGYALAGSPPGRAIKGEAIRLDAGMNAQEAFAAIAGSCIRHYRLNETLLLNGDGVDAVHQARVAIRRLRSALSLFAPLFTGDGTADLLASELRWLARELGKIRDIDVLLPTLQGEMHEALAEVRGTSFDHLRALLESGRVRLLPIELAEWLAIGAWLREPATAVIRSQDIRHFAGRRLDRLRKRISREDNLAGADDHRRHELRKDAKKLRYAAEFVGSLYQGGKARRRYDRLLARIENLQDKLGQLNDIAAGPALLTRLNLPMALPKLGRKKHRRLLTEAEQCFEQLIGTKRFWRT